MEKQIDFYYDNKKFLCFARIVLTDGKYKAERRVWLGLGFLLGFRLRRKVRQLKRCHRKLLSCAK
jgi:hypothetical protein